MRTLKTSKIKLVDNSKTSNCKKRMRGRAWERKRQKVFIRDGFTCRICKQAKACEVDHIRPLAKGGTDDLNNLQSVCIPCHKQKTSIEQSTIFI